MTDMKVKPSLEKFKGLAKSANLIAVSTEISMDLDTPVSVYYKLVGEKKGFIFRESNPKDRRNKIVKLTEEGAQYANCILEELRSMEIVAFASIPQEQRRAISETFSFLGSSLNKFLLK